MDDKRVTQSCGCYISWSTKIVYCPLHAAAPEMKEALAKAIALIEPLGFGADHYRWLAATRELLRKATLPASVAGGA